MRPRLAGGGGGRTLGGPSGARDRSRAWIDYVFRLFTRAPAVAPDGHHRRATFGSQSRAGGQHRRVPALSRVMRAAATGLGPAERFLVRRLEGLEGVLAS